MREEQERILKQLGDSTTLHGEADVARLAGIGYDQYPHQQVSIRGMGWAVLSTRSLPVDTQGQPNLLFYASGTAATEYGPRDGFDFPYAFVGWGYAPNYDPSKYPLFLGRVERSDEDEVICLTREDWFVHERGIHPFEDGGMDAVPPEEKHRGEARGEIPPVPGVDGRAGLSHFRLWDIHFWLNEDGVPTLGILNSGRRIPGFDPEIGTDWFYPAPMQSFMN